ncbi:MAG: SRPBCC family protein [Hyphomonadaceae bacterium]
MSEYGEIVAPRTVRLERLLPGPVERVWEYLIDSEKRGAWLARGEVEPRVGGRIELIWDNDTLTPGDGGAPKGSGKSQMVGRVTQFDPPHTLAFLWTIDAAETEVTFALAPAGEQVRLTITHARLGDRGRLLSVSSGWHAHVGVLEDKLAGRAPRPFWGEVERLAREYEGRLGQD